MSREFEHKLFKLNEVKQRMTYLQKKSEVLAKNMLSFEYKVFGCHRRSAAYVWPQEWTEPLLPRSLKSHSLRSHPLKFVWRWEIPSLYGSERSDPSWAALIFSQFFGSFIARITSDKAIFASERLNCGTVSVMTEDAILSFKSRLIKPFFGWHFFKSCHLLKQYFKLLLKQFI